MVIKLCVEFHWITTDETLGQKKKILIKKKKNNKFQICKTINFTSVIYDC